MIGSNTEPGFPHIIVSGSCFGICTSLLVLLRLLLLRRLLHIPTSLSHTFFHTQLSHTHTQLCHRPSFTHLFVTHTHSLSHTSLSHIFLIHIFVTHPFPQLSHTHLCYTHTHNLYTRAKPRHFCMAGLALGDIHRRLTWQGWCLATSSFVLHIFVTHHLSHTSLLHTISATHPHTHTHTQLFRTQHCHTPFFTHIFVTHYLSHTTVLHTTLHIQPFNSSIIHHLLCLSFTVPLELFASPFWKKLTAVGFSGPLILGICLFKAERILISNSG